MSNSIKRMGRYERSTSETRVEAEVAIEGEGRCEADTGIGFLDHMLTALAKHSGFDIVLKCKGDLHIDDHHSSEDCALALGEAFNRALADRRGILRFGDAMAPLDESLARAVVDLSGRPHATIDLGINSDRLGTWSSENVPHFFRSFATAGRLCLHLDVIRGDNNHHRVEAAFKSVALALRNATELSGGNIPSTKGVL